MSNTAALALVVASLSAGFAGYIYASKWAHEVAIQIVAGTALTAPLPMSWRWRLLYGRWVYLPVSISAFLALIAGVNIRIAALTNDQGTRLAAYFVAAAGALIAVSWLAYGSIEFLHLRNVLRQAEAD